MSEDTVKIPGRSSRLKKITGALSSIPVADDDRRDIAGEVRRLTERSFRALPESEKLELMRSLREQLVEQQERYLSLLKISSALGATFDRHEFLEMTMDHVTDVVDAERSTLYLIDPETGVLRGTIAQGAETTIELAPGQGIAGWVAEHGETLNIADAQQDPRFFSDFDDQNDFRTGSVLCQPLRNADDDIIAVLQALNSHHGSFSADDEHLLSAIGGQISIALENSKLYHSIVEKNQQLVETTEKLEQKIAELDLLYDIQRDLSQPSDLDSLIETITRKTLELVNGKACALTLDEDGEHHVYVMIDRSTDYTRTWDYYSRVVDPDSTVARRVIDRGESFVCHDGGCRCVPGPTPREAGLDPDNVVAIPLYDDDVCIGALQVYDLALPQDPTQLGFTEDDVKLLTLIASQIAGTVASRRRRERREKQDRLSTIGQMIAGILHDFKTPFSVISGYVQLMADADDRDQRKEYADRVLQQFRELNQMTRELLKFARGDSKILLRKTLVHKFVEELRELLATEFQNHDIDFEVDVEYRGEALFDPVKIKRSILNLARNSIEAMPDGGRVTLRVEQHGDDLRIVFSDTGQGIPPEIRGRLFDSFVTRGKQEGTGLGLAVVKKIVDEHGGTITFDSAVGEGTTFYIDLPLSPPEDDDAADTD